MRKTNNLTLFFLFALTQIILSTIIDFGPIYFVSVYPLFLLTRQSVSSTHSNLLWAFAMGFVVDYFTHSLAGINSAAALVMALSQNKILKLAYRKGELDYQSRPGMRELGVQRFVFYVGLSLLIHHVVLVLIESFGFTHLLYNLPRLAVSLIINLLLIILIELGFFYKNRK